MGLRIKFRDFQKYAVYYGNGNLARLSRYDVVVVEPGQQSSEDVQFLRSHGTLVLAYVSVMEIHSHHPLMKAVVDADFLRSENPPHEFIVQETYQTRLLNLTSAHWRGILIRHIGRLLTQEGYDGIFLDTIGDVEDSTIPRSYEQLEYAVQIVAQIRQWFPDSILVQNNGLEALCMRTAEFLDGIVWENPPIALPDSRHWVKAIAERLERLRDTFNLRILVLFEGSGQDTRSNWIVGRNFAAEYNFTSYFSPQHYLTFHG